MSKQMVSTPDAPKAIGPYSQAIRSGSMLFSSGQVGLDPETGELAEGLEAQVRRALTNLSSVLDAGGASLDSVVKTTVFLASMDDFTEMNDIYAQYFTGDPPARSTVAVKTLPKNALFEIEAIAEVTQA